MLPPPSTQRLEAEVGVTWSKRATDVLFIVRVLVIFNKKGLGEVHLLARGGDV